MWHPTVPGTTLPQNDNNRKCEHEMMTIPISQIRGLRHRRGRVHPRSHSWEVAEPGLEPGPLQQSMWFPSNSALILLSLNVAAPNTEGIYVRAVCSAS